LQRNTRLWTLAVLSVGAIGGDPWKTDGNLDVGVFALKAK
jgi:hypothetical protein